MKSARNILLMAASMGLLTGLVEGAGMLAMQNLGWLNWNMAQVSVSAEIIWISAVAGLLLFLVVGVLLAMIAKLLPDSLAMRFAAGTLTLALFFDWLALSGRIRHSGAAALSVGLAVVYARWFSKHEPAAVSFWRRSLPWLAGATLATFIVIQGGQRLLESRAVAALPQSPAGAPNVLVIVVDTLRADRLSAYGHSRPTSPNLDKLTQQGVLFENAIATSSWTLPSHASLLTGRYEYENRAAQGGFGGKLPTLSEELRDRGYRTGAFSANTFFFSRRMGFGRGFLHFEDYFHSLQDMAARTLYGRKFSQYVLRRFGFEDIPGRKLAADVNRGALAWLDRDSSRPFFVFLNYFDTHDPFLPPQPWRGKFSQRPNPGGILNSFAHRYYPEMTAEELQSEKDAYDGAVAYVDDAIGKLLESLRSRGLLENTIVVVTSDHGEMLGEHGLYLHRNCLYREVIHVPLIIAWFGKDAQKIPAGARVPRPVTNAALPATVVELLGGAAQTKFPGPSLATLWKDPSAAADWPDALAELGKFPFEPVKKEPAYHGWMKTLVNSQWQFIVHEKFGYELYDWTADPQQARNLAAAAEAEQAARAMASKVEKITGEKLPAAKPTASQE